MYIFVSFRICLENGFRENWITRLDSIVFSVPIWFDTAHVIEGDLPPKPLLIAHRGVQQFAPENTIPAFQLASDMHLYGVEFDIVISIDGIPFIMHDRILRRTTNVDDVFPQKKYHLAQYFTIDEIKQLDAGNDCSENNL